MSYGIGRYHSVRQLPAHDTQQSYIQGTNSLQADFMKEIAWSDLFAMLKGFFLFIFQQVQLLLAKLMAQRGDNCRNDAMT